MPEDSFPAGLKREFLELIEILKDDESTGVLLTGMAGSGKMHLVDAALSSTSLLDTSIRLICSASLTEVEYGAVAPLLTGLSQENIGVVAVRNALASVREILRGYTNATKLLVVLEDAQFIDPASAFVLGQIVQAGLIRLIVVTSEDHMDAMALDQLTIGSRLHRIVVERLSLDEVRSLCEELLEGKISVGSVKIIDRQTNGIYLLIKEFVLASRRQSILVQRHGRWVLKKTTPKPDDSLRDRILGLQHRFSKPMRNATEMLSLMGTTPVRLLEKLTGIEVANEDINGLIIQDGQNASISSNFYAEILRSLIPPSRGAKLEKQLRAAVDDIPPTRFDAWPLKSQRNLDEGMILKSLREANDKRKFEEAWKLYGENELENSDSCVEAARALVGLNRPHMALGLLESFSHSDVGGHLEQKIRDMNAICYWSLSEDPSEAYLSSALPPVDEQGTSRELATTSRNESEDIYRGDKWFIDMLSSIRNLYTSGRPLEAAERALWARSKEGHTLASRSRYELALAVEETRSYIAVGQYKRAKDVIANYPLPDDGETLFAHGTLQVLSGIVAMRQGQTNYSVELMADGIPELSVNDPTGLKLIAAGIYAFLTSYGSNSETETTDLLSEIEDFGVFQDINVRQSNLRWSSSDQYLAQAFRELSSSSPRDTELRQQLRLAQSASDNTATSDVAFICWSADVTSDLTQETAEILLAFEEFPQGTRNELQQRLVLIERSKEFERFIDFALSAFESGEPLLAIEGLARFVRFQNDPGSERQRGMALRQIDAWLRELGASPWGIVAEALSSRGLTRRETEIVELVRTGLSNKEISRYLTVSQRTVEGHLYRVFAKLGINDRNELGDPL